jgi:hypothetical protein
MADGDLTKEWETAKPLTPNQEWDTAKPVKSGGLATSDPLAGEIKKSEPWWVESIRPTMEYGGMAAGAAAGALSPVPGGTMIGAGLGYATGRTAADTTREVLGYNKPQSLESRAYRATEGFLEGGLLEGAGAFGGKILGATAKEITPEVKAALETFKKYNIKPLPSEIAPSRTKSLLEGVLSYTPASGDVFYKRGMERVQMNDSIMQQLIDKGAPQETIEHVGNLIKRDAKEILERYSNKKAEEINRLVEGLTGRYGTLTKAEAGGTFGDIMKGNRLARRGEIDSLEADLEASLPKAGKDKITMTPEIIDTMKMLRDKELAKSSALRNDKLLAIFNDYIPKKGKVSSDLEALIRDNPWALEKNPELKAEIEAMQAEKPVIKEWQGLRGDKAELQELSKSIKTREHRGTTESYVLDTLTKKIDAEMEKYAEGVGGDVWGSYQSARKATTRLHEVYDKDLLKIMDKKPEEIVDSIIRGGERGLSTLKQIKEAVGEQGIVPLRKGFFKKQLDEATVNGVLSPEKLRRNMGVLKDNIPGKIGVDVRKELLTSEQNDMIDNIINRGIEINTKVGRNTINFLETLAGASNEKVVEAMVKPENVHNIRFAKRLLSSDRIDQIKSSVLEEKIFKTSGAGHMLPISSSKAFENYKTVLKELLDPEHYKNLDDFLKMGRYSDRIEKLAVNASHTGQILIGHGIIKSYFSALSQMATGHIVAGGTQAAKTTSELVLGRMLAKIYTSDLAAKYFTGAMKLGPSPEGVSSFIKAIGIVALTEEPPTATSHGVKRTQATDEKWKRLGTE